MIERFAAFARRFDEHFQVGAHPVLADEFVEDRRTQPHVGRVPIGLPAGDQAIGLAGIAHDASSRRLERIKASTRALSP